MKRFAVLAMMAAFVLSTVGLAYATELKVRGTWRVQLNHINNPTFDDDAEIDQFSAQQRMRTIFEFIANENLRGVLQLEIGDLRWGFAGPAAGRGVGGAIGTDGVNIETRHAFINFKVPNTEVDVKAGLQAVALPSTLGSHILAADVGAVVANVPFNDMASLTLGWARALDEFTRDRDAVPATLVVDPAAIDPAAIQAIMNAAADPAVTAALADFNAAIAAGDSVAAAEALAAIEAFRLPVPFELRPGRPAEQRNDELDVFLAVLPLKLEGARVNPFVAMSLWSAGVNAETEENATMWHTGVNFSVTALEPIVIRGDLNYGTVDWGTMNGVNIEQAGWVGLLAVEYAMDMVTPQLFAVYETGEDAADLEEGESRRMPAINTDGGAFGPGVGLGTASAFAGNNFLRRVLDDVDPQAEHGAIGMWALGAALRDIKSMDKLSHDLVAFYARGTNEEETIFLFTAEDSYWEMNFNTRYQMYENLALILELAYGKVSLDDLNLNIGRDEIADDAMTRAVLGLVYRF
jgi:hypothetical protein